MREIKNKNGKTLVKIKRLVDWNSGLDFLTSDDEYLQVGTWLYDEGKTLDRHYHNVVERQSDLTQECVVVLSGKMLVRVYDETQALIDDFIVTAGDFAIFLGGGHDYTIMENGTKIVEVKNGPFLGVELDKTRF